MELIEGLFAALHTEIDPNCPATVVPMRQRLAGFAAFPAGYGLFTINGGDWGECLRADLAPVPVGGVMFVGHDFDTSAGFERRLKEREAALATDAACIDARPHRRNLLQYPRYGGVEPERCWFTNAYPGLRKEGRNTGKSPQERDQVFARRCQRFFLRQLSVLRPRVVFTLGKWVPKFVAELSPELARWRGLHKWKHIDEAGPVVHGATFPGVVGLVCSVTALSHHCCRPANVKRRRYRQLVGHEAEVQMIREAFERTGLAGVPVEPLN